jgi:hypothetical protein
LRIPPANEKATANGPTEEESMQLFTFLFSFMKASSDTFDFWWRFFKNRLAPILYPNECKSLELLNKLDDMGFTQKCPYKLHLIILDTILDGLESPKKSEVLYSSDKDIYMFLLIFRQSFLLPPAHYDQLSKMLKTYRSWICKDYFLYNWPEIMERSRNTYYRVFIDNLAQTFYMKGEDAYMDLHINMCYEAFEIFQFFTNIAEKVEFETWNDLLATHIQIYEHLIERVNSTDSYDNQIGKMLERTCIRNLFVIWIKAHPDDNYVELWNSFYELLHKHFGLENLFHMWKITAINLSRVIIHRIFGLSLDLIDSDFTEYTTEMYELEKKNKKWKINQKPHTITGMKELFFKLEEETILHLWHRVINMYGTENANISGELHTKKIKVVAEIVNLYLSISQKEVKVIKGTTPPPFLHSPEGNKLLTLFMEWLMEGCARKDSSFAEGQYIAYVSLCKLICQKCSQELDKKFLAHAYRALHTGLNSAQGATPKTIEAIFLNARHFFSMGYVGSNILIPDFIEAASGILKDSASKDLRISAIHVLISIICTCYFYDNGDLPDVAQVLRTKTLPSRGANDDTSNQNHTYVKLRARVCQMLMLAVVDDRFPEAQIKCLWGLYLIVHKELTSYDDKGSSVKFIIDAILSFIVHKDDTVAQSALDAIVSMAHNELFPKLGDGTVKNIISTICDNLLNQLKQNTTSRAKVIKHMFYTIVELLQSVPQAILEAKEIATKLFSAIQTGLAVVPLNTLTDPKYKLVTNTAQTGTGNTQTDQEKSYEIAVAAESLLAFVLNSYGHFPCPNGAARISSQMSEFDLLEESSAGLIEPSPKIHHFIFNDYTLLTVMESPQHPECCRIIVRDMTGKYCWEHRMVFSQNQATFKRLDGDTRVNDSDAEDEEDGSVTPSTPVQEAVTEEAPATPVEQKPKPVDEPVQQETAVQQTEIVEATEAIEEEYNSDEGEGGEQAEEADYPHYDSEIDTDKTDMLEILQHYVAQVFPECDVYSKPAKIKLGEMEIDTAELQGKMAEQSQSEGRLLSSTEHPDFPVTEITKKTDPLELIVFKAFRALLNNVGYLSLSTRNSFARIDANHKFYRTLKQFDKLGERETIKIGVIYVGNEQESARDLIKNEKGSDLYNEFLQGLGWDVDLKTHVGFMGGLDANLTTGTVAPYYSNSTTEVIFHVVTNMPTKPNDQQQIHKKRHIGNDIVHIVWSEHDRDYRPWTITSQFNFVHIVIYPLKDPFFRVQIYAKPEVPPFGPLVNGMIVDKKVLAPLVRMTAMNANKAVRYSTEGYNKPYPTRRAMVNEIVERFKMNGVKNEDFLKPLFFDQIYAGVEMGELIKNKAGIHSGETDETTTQADENTEYYE